MAKVGGRRPATVVEDFRLGAPLGRGGRLLTLTWGRRHGPGWFPSVPAFHLPTAHPQVRGRLVLMSSESCLKPSRRRNRPSSHQRELFLDGLLSRSIALPFAGTPTSPRKFQPTLPGLCSSFPMNHLPGYGSASVCSLACIRQRRVCRHTRSMRPG